MAHRIIPIVNEAKVCTRCKQSVPLADFGLNKNVSNGDSNGYSLECMECVRNKQQSYNRQNDIKKSAIMIDELYQEIKDGNRTKNQISRLKMAYHKIDKKYSTMKDLKVKEKITLIVEIAKSKYKEIRSIEKQEKELANSANKEQVTLNSNIMKKENQGAVAPQKDANVSNVKIGKSIAELKAEIYAEMELLMSQLKELDNIPTAVETAPETPKKPEPMDIDTFKANKKINVSSAIDRKIYRELQDKVFETIGEDEIELFEVAVLEYAYAEYL